MAGGVNVSLTANVQQFQQQMRQAEQALTHFQTTARRTTDALGDIGMPAAGAFAALTLGIGAATNAFGSFESVLNQVKAVSGATASEMAAVKAQAEQLGAATKFSAREAAQAQAELAKSGMNINQVLAATPGVMALAAAGQLEVGRAAEITGAALNGFGKSAEEAAYVADLLATAANASALDVADVGESFKYVAPVAQATSQSIEDVAMMLATMGNAGIKGSMGGTVMASALASLTRPSDEAATKLNALKISIQDTQGKMLPLADIIGQLKTNMAGMTEVQKANAITTIFGVEAMKGILAVMNQTPAKAKEVADSFGKVGGAADTMSTKMNAGFKGAMEQFGGSVDTAVTALGEQLAPAIMAVAEVVKGLVDGFTALEPQTKTMIAGAVAAATAVAGLTAMVAAGAAALPLITAGLTLMGGALLPVIAGVAALSAGVGIATVALRDQAQAGNQTTASLKAQGDKVNGLVAEYDKLQQKTKLTADEQARHKAILDELQKLAPDVIGSYDGMGNATGINRDRLFDMNNELRTQIELLNQAQTAAKNKSLADRDAARFSLYAAETDVRNKQQEIKDALKGALGQGRGGLERVKALQAELRVLEDIKTSRARYAREAATAFDTSFPVRATGKPTTTTTTTTRTPGGIVGAPAGKGGKTDAQKEAEEIAKAAEEIAMAYREAAVEKTIAMRTASGAVIDFVRKEEAEELAVATEIAKGYGAAQDEKVAAMLAANNLIERAGWELANELDAATQQGIREMQGALTALAVDPSLERIANFAQGLAADKGKLEEWGKTLGEIGSAFNGASGDANDFGAALGKIGVSLDPISLAVTAVVSLGMAIKGAFDDARKAMAEAAEQAQSLAIETARIKAGLIDDPGARAHADYDVAKSSIEKELKQKLKEDNERQDKAEFSGTFYFGEGSNRGIDAFPETKKWYEAKLAEAGKNFKDAIEQAKEATGGAVARMAENAQHDQQRIEEAFNTYEGMLDRLGDIDEELNRGGRDDWGRKITLELEKQQQLLKQQEENAKRLNSLIDRKLKLEEDLAQLKLDAAKAIRDIENEGLAVRALTESQDKSVRIEKVKVEYAKKRLDITDEITKVNDDITLATLEAEQALSRINIQYQERFAALDLEASKLTANVQLAQQQLGIERSITDEIRRRQSSSSSGSSSTPPQRSTPGAATGSTTYRQQYFHTGGSPRDLKPDEIEAVVKKNEFILTPTQMNNLLAAAARQRGAMGMPSGVSMPPSQMVQSHQTQVITVNLGGITVDGGFDLNNTGERRQLASKLAQDLNPMLGGVVRRALGGR